MVAAIPPIGALPQVAQTAPSVAPTAAPGFGDAVRDGLAHVSGLEQQADQLTQRMASGETVAVHELMTATAKAQVGVELLSTVRDRAVEAYQEIMRLPV